MNSLSIFLFTVTQALAFPWNTIVTDLPLLLDFISDIWLQGYFIEFTPTQIYFYTWILFFFFYHFLPINIRCHIMILFLLPLLLQSRLHINTISISQPVPNHAYLFKTLHLTHQLLNTWNPTLASDCWICLSISSPRGSALSISTGKWTHINTSLYHTYRGEYLFLLCIHYLYSIDQIHNPDKILTSLLWQSSTTGSFLFYQTKFYKQFLPPTGNYSATPL